MVGAVVMVASGDDAYSQREVGWQFLLSATQHISFVEQRSNHACERLLALG